MKSSSRSRKNATQQASSTIPRLDSLKQINLHAAGLDIGASEIYACVPEESTASSVRCFPTFTADLYQLADWLQACQITTVAMESTGVYWIPIFQILEQRGFEVYLVNAQYIKNVTGKKTDILDCQWIQQLHTYGLLHASFRPDEQTCVLRALVRQREMLLRYRAGHIQHIQKALQQMNVLLTNVLSDITGVTGFRILRAIINGNHDPQQLAQYRDGRCSKSEAEIAKSLHGDYRPEHLFALQKLSNSMTSTLKKSPLVTNRLKRNSVNLRLK
jgi:transposase